MTSSKWTCCLGFLCLLAALAGPSWAQVSFEMIDLGSASSMSADGSVIVGYVEASGGFSPFRWTAAGGVVDLGQSASLVGVGAGFPVVSKDGTRVAATIAGLNLTYITQGMWIEGSGWMELMPPTPPDGGLFDLEYGTAWAISGDGLVVGGYYWRPGAQIGGSAHASRWTQELGVVSLVPESAPDSRVNGINYDGSVIVGWSANPGFGNWWPTVWVDGVQTVLDTMETWAEVKGCNDAGTLLLGQNVTDPSDPMGPATWTWNGNSWDNEVYPPLFGTHPIYGNAAFTHCTPDGSLIVGYNVFNPGSSTGILWTQDTGMVDVEQWLLLEGVSLPPSFQIRSLVGVSDEGSVICGTGQETDAPYAWKFFKIHITDPTDAPMARGSAQLGRNYPNPFNPATTIPVVLTQDGSVQLEIYDVRGQKVRVLHSGVLSAGRHEFRWNGQDESGAPVSTGTYMARLRMDDGSEQSTRMVLLK